MNLVYQIATVPYGGSAFATNRSETWIVEVSEECSSPEEANRVMREKCRASPEFRRLAVTITGPDADQRKAEFLEEFCTSDKYLLERRYFVGRPPVQKIQDLLQSNRITVIDNRVNRVPT